MTNKEAISRWAEIIIPSVFKAEDALLNEKPEWKERLANITQETAKATAKEYCREIAEIIVKNGTDYDPDEQE